MIELKKETDAEKIKEISKKEGINFSEDIKLFVAKDKEETLGYSIFEMTDKLCVLNIDTPPILWNSIGDGLFRATLNFAIESGITSGSIDEKLLEKLKGSVIPEEKLTATIDDCETFLQSIKRCGR